MSDSMRNATRNPSRPVGLALAAAVLCATLGLIAGCGVTAGVHLPSDAGDVGVATFRYDFEFIPNAVMVKEDTSPDWLLGRYAFSRGPDRLLVITRLTSWPETREQDRRDRDQRLRPVVEDERYRNIKVVERAWITIPNDVPVGQQVKLEDLNQRFLVGYDRGDFPLPGEIYVQANRPRGTVQMIEMNDDNVVFRLNVELRPEKHVPWKLDEEVVVPVYADGLHARRFVDPNLVPPAARREVGEVESITPDIPNLPEGPVIPGEQAEPASQNLPESIPGGEAGGTDTIEQPAPDHMDPDNPGLEEDPGMVEAPNPDAPPAERLVGKWIYSDPSSPFELRFQFQDNGRFVYAATRRGGAYNPGMMYGRYEVEDGGLKLHVDRYEYAGLDHMEFLPSKELAYDLYWIRDEPVLAGEFRQHKMTPRLQRTNFPDMNYVLPPKGASGKYEF